MPVKPPPDPPAQATAKELQEYIENMKECGKQLEEEAKKERTKLQKIAQPSDLHPVCYPLVSLIRANRQS